MDLPQADSAGFAEASKIIQPGPLPDAATRGLNKNGKVFFSPNPEQPPAPTLSIFNRPKALEHMGLMQLGKLGILASYHSLDYKPMICRKQISCLIFITPTSISFSAHAHFWQIGPGKGSANLYPEDDVGTLKEVLYIKTVPI